ncbi:MAG: nuclear transport factor 2 family protein [Thermomicrobiales bacterium]|nr:nuclear transport factor 2 family protein [Thermomicrobiales bacterium]
MPTSKSLAEEFLTHFNARNQEGLLALVDADLRYNGRHGEGEGILLLREWVERATTTMTPRRWFGQDSLAVVEVDVEWRSPKTGEITDRATWALSIVTEEDRILAISRYADVGEAVTKMGLQPEDILPEMGFPEAVEG